MWLEFAGETLDVLGKIMIAITVIAVHDSVAHEKKYDKKVAKSIRKEHVYAFLGIILILAGYALKELGRFSQ